MKVFPGSENAGPSLEMRFHSYWTAISLSSTSHNGRRLNPRTRPCARCSLAALALGRAKRLTRNRKPLGVGHRNCACFQCVLLALTFCVRNRIRSSRFSGLRQFHAPHLGRNPHDRHGPRSTSRDAPCTLETTANRTLLMRLNYLDIAMKCAKYHMVDSPADLILQLQEYL